MKGMFLYMKNSFLTHKLLPILSILILCTFVLSTSVFASYDFTYNGKDYSLPDLPSDIGSHYFIIVGDGTKSYLFYSDSPIVVSHFGSTHIQVPKVSSSNTSVFLRSFDRTGDFSWGNPSSPPSSVTFLNSIVYSTFNVMDTDGNVVFRVAPQAEIPEITKALVEQTTQLGMKPLEVIKVVLPIVIVTIVGLIAFWKAWQFLLKQLRKA